MKRLVSFRPLGLLLVFAIAALCACGGTETGNPNPANGPALQNPVLALMEAICGKLEECGEFPPEFDCRVDLLESETLGPEFGAGEEAYPVYVDLLVAADRGDLDIDRNALDLCISSIQALGCDDQAVQDVIIDETGIHDLEQMIPETGCPSVFGPP